MTLIGVVIAVVQLFRGVSQQKTNFEDSLTKEYREIIHRIPYKAMIGDEIDDEESYKTFNEIYNYMDLCNEQIFLRKTGRVRAKTWRYWQEGMLTNFSQKVFDRASQEIFSKLRHNFTELKRVQDSGYKTDPRKW